MSEMLQQCLLPFYGAAIHSHGKLGFLIAGPDRNAVITRIDGSRIMIIVHYHRREPFQREPELQLDLAHPDSITQLFDFLKEKFHGK